MEQQLVHRILVIDDKQEHLDELPDDLKFALEDLGEIDVIVRSSFEEAEVELRSLAADYDVVVLDVMMGEPDAPGYEGNRGVELYRKIRGIRWVPVVFYTGLPSACDGLEAPPLISVVPKDEPALLYEKVRAALESGAGRMARNLVRKIDGQVRAFLGHHVAPNWGHYNELEGDGIEHVLVGRLAAFLREWEAGEGGEDSEPIGHSAVPASYYLMPPLSRSGLRAGSIFREADGNWWIVLTPTCDLFTNETYAGNGKVRFPKANRVLLAKLVKVYEHPKISKFLTSGGSISETKKVLSGHQDEARWYYLPAFLSIPDLLVDLEYLKTEPLDAIVEPEWFRVADLDSPFMEVLLARQSHWRGRIGKPDLDWEKQVKLLQPER
ncbi:CheY-like chemotaxis protein [Arthrobacter bambusae]|uniref:CheY-like chemotaxis protein n=1 Tax=Arthrobacter bambusae TaxID=1338426 RepID=A0ABV2P7Z1_9MICC